MSEETVPKVVYDITWEQRNFWKERAENLEKLLAIEAAVIKRIDTRMGAGWTMQLADALTAHDAGAES